MNKNKLLFVSGNMITYIGDALINFIISWWLVKMTGDTKLLGFVLGIAILPAVIINLIMGKVLDRYDKKKLMVWCDLASGMVCVIAYFLIDSKFFPYVLTGVTFILFILNNIFSLSSKSIIKFLFLEEEVVSVNSFYTFAKQLSKIVGPLLGGGLILFFQPKVFILINGISFFFSAFIEMNFEYVKKPENKKNTSQQKLDKTAKQSSFAIIKEQKLEKMIIFIMANNFFMTAVNIYIPFMVITVFDKEQLLGVALASQSIGSLCAVFFTKKIAKGFSYEMLAALASASLLLCIGNIYFLSIGLFTYGLFLTMFNVKFSTDLQLRTADHLIGRVFSIVISLGLILVPIGNFVFGMTGKIFGGYCLFVIGGLLVIINISFLILKARESEN